MYNTNRHIFVACKWHDFKRRTYFLYKHFIQWKIKFSSSWKIWGTDEEEIQEQKKTLEHKHPGNLETKISLFFIDL